MPRALDGNYVKEVFLLKGSNGVTFRISFSYPIAILELDTSKGMIYLHKYVAIYTVNVLKTPFRITHLSSVSITFFKGPITYRVPLQVRQDLPQEEKKPIAKITDLRLNGKNDYVEFMVETDENPDQNVEGKLQNNIDRVITYVCLTFGSGIIGSNVYRGWLWNEQEGNFYVWLKKATAPVSVEEAPLISSLNSIEKTVTSSSEIFSRFQLMSRFYCKQLEEDPGVEKFLWLWTILEIFPMKNTRDIKPISECLSYITRQSAGFIKDKLEIGKLYGLRCDLVHYGKFDMDVPKLAVITTKLGLIVWEILRYMVGLKYTGSLDGFLK